MLRHRTSIVVVAILLLVACTIVIAARPKPAAKVDAPKTDANGQPIPPSDAQYTLYCLALGGPGHVEQADHAKDELAKLTSTKDWYIIHSDGQSVIYYGFYRAVNAIDKDKKEVERAQRDRKMIENLTDTPGKAGGNKLFTRVFFVPITEPDPVAPAEWNLANSGGYWSWQIAAYKDSPRRKQAAVDAVREARKNGINAFYYHGETTSSVCVGAWPKNAVVGEDEDVAGVATDPTQDVVVMSQPLANQENLQFHARNGDRIRDMTPSYKASDPSLIAIMAQYPTHAINGETMVTKTNGKSMEDPAFLVRIKKPEPSLLRADGQPVPAREGAAPATPELLVPPPTPGAAAGGGKLRSIGD